MVLVNLAWLWLVSFTAVTWNTGGFESVQDKRVLTTRNCGIAQGLHNQWILWTQMWTEKITKWSCYFNSSQVDVNMWSIPECILLARVETYILYCVHSRVYRLWSAHTFTVQKCRQRKGKMVHKQPCSSYTTILKNVTATHILLIIICILNTVV